MSQDEAAADRTFMGGHARAGIRSAAPLIATLESLATMIPDQNGLSVLRGALTTVFKVGALFFLCGGLSSIASNCA